MGNTPIIVSQTKLLIKGLSFKLTVAMVHSVKFKSPFQLFDNSKFLLGALTNALFSVCL